ncbi:MAG: penicillin acylase family protein [Acidobacteriota bacterium]
MKRRLIQGLIVLAVLVAVAFLASYFWFWGSGLPQRGGEASLAGLDSAVTVHFDEVGVPTIVAESAPDALAALGWLHANERFTQLELTRRRCTGRLTELVGEAALPLDIGARQLCLRQIAELLWQSASDESREVLEAYADGVNAWLEERGGDLPPSLKLLGVKPEPWTPVDSLCVGPLMAEDLSFWQGRPEERRYLWLKALGAERGLELVDPGPAPHLPQAIAELAAGSSVSDAASSAAESGSEVGTAGAEAAGSAPPGSNNWVVGSSRSATGGPLVANDPHLGISLPSTWYLVEIRSPDYTVAGASLPGTPGVIIGRTESLAWAVTNVMLDDHDLFFEDLQQPEGEPWRVRRGEIWEVVEEREEVFLLKDGSTRSVTLRRTDIGPLYQPVPRLGLPARSLAWTAFTGGDPTLAMLQLARAQSVDEVPEAISPFHVPAQNLFAADRDGGLIHAILGRLPNRLQGDGRLPAPAWDESYGWDGLLPWQEEPTIRQPAVDYLASANQRVNWNPELVAETSEEGKSGETEALLEGASAPITVPGDYVVSGDYDADHRYDRLVQILEAQSTWSFSDLAAVQQDIVSVYPKRLLAPLPAPGADAPEGARRAWEALNAWDGSYTLESAAAALFAFFEEELESGIFADEAEAGGFELNPGYRRTVRLVEGEISPEWWDDVSTASVEGPQEIFTAALERAWQRGVEIWGEPSGSDLSPWRYGDIHELMLSHPMASAPVVGSYFTRGPYQVAGSGTTLNAFEGFWGAEGSPEENVQRVAVGPSLRMVSDLGSADGAYSMGIPGGQSGHPFDIHYDNQIELFLAGKLNARALFAEPSSGGGTLVLQPAVP